MSEIDALRIKENWFNQLVDWLRFAHPEVHKDYLKRVMAVNKITDAPEAPGPPPAITVSARPEAVDDALVGGREK